MKIIKYVFALVFLANFSAILGMQKKDDEDIEKMQQEITKDLGKIASEWDLIFYIGSYCDKEKVLRFLNAGYDVNERVYGDNNMLSYAISFHNECDNKNNCNIRTVSKKKKLEFIEFLLSKGAKLSSKDKTDRAIDSLKRLSNYSTDIIGLLQKYDALIQ